jgi:hypothetical protein
LIVVKSSIGSVEGLTKLFRSWGVCEINADDIKLGDDLMSVRNEFNRLLWPIFKEFRKCVDLLL